MSGARRVPPEGVDLPLMLVRERKLGSILSAQTSVIRGSNVLCLVSGAAFSSIVMIRLRRSRVSTVQTNRPMCSIVVSPGTTGSVHAIFIYCS